MSLPTNLTTNEVKNAAGTEIEFSALSRTNREVQYRSDAELPNAPHRLKISHLESGKGTNRRRRSLVRFDKSFVGEVDTDSTASASCYVVLDLPIGNMADYDEAQGLCANMMAFFASKGLDTTILFDGTGYGANAAIYGTL